MLSPTRAEGTLRRRHKRFVGVMHDNQLSVGALYAADGSVEYEGPFPRPTGDGDELYDPMPWCSF